MPFLVWLVSALEPETCVELGSGGGRSYRALCQILDRFSPRSKLVGVDPWKGGPGGDPASEAAYRDLTEYSATRHAGRASVLRTELDGAAEALEDRGVDLVHVVGQRDLSGTAALDAELWARMIRPGGVLIVTATTDGALDDTAAKVWQQLIDWFPSVSLRSPTFLGMVQVPGSGDETPLIRELEDQPALASALFGCLGDRIEYRHSFGTEPVSPRGIQRHFGELAETHSREIQMLRDRHEGALESLRSQSATLADRLLAKSQELEDRRVESDLLLAEIAARSAAHERALAARDERFRAELDQRDAHLAAITATRSWRYTTMLRDVRRKWIRFDSLLNHR